MWCTIASSSSSSVCVRARVLIIINHCAIVCHTRVQDSPVLVSSYPPKKVSEFPLPAPAKPAPLSPLFTIQQLPLCLRWCDHSLSRTNTSKRGACFGEWPSCSWKFSKFKFIVFVAFFFGWIHWGGKKNPLRARRVNPNLLENSGAVRRRGQKCLFVWCKFDILENLLAQII